MPSTRACGRGQRDVSTDLPPPRPARRRGRGYQAAGAARRPDPTERSDPGRPHQPGDRQADRPGDSPGHGGRGIVECFRIDRDCTRGVDPGLEGAGKWIDANRAGIRIRDRLGDDAREWAEADPEKKEGFLYTALALRWRANGQRRIATTWAKWRSSSWRRARRPMRKRPTANVVSARRRKPGPGRNGRSVSVSSLWPWRPGSLPPYRAGWAGSRYPMETGRATRQTRRESRL